MSDGGHQGAEIGAQPTPEQQPQLEEQSSETQAQPPQINVQHPLSYLSPDEVRRQIEQEQALVDAQRRVKELEEEVGMVKRNQAVLEGDKEGAVNVTNQLRTQLSALQSSHHQTTSELSVLHTRVETAEREKKELYEEAERLQQRSNKSNQELYALRAAKSEASQKIAHLDVEASELRMATETAKFNEKRSSQALESARAEIMTLSKAVADTEERFGRYRAQTQAEQSQSRAEQDTLLTRVNTLESNYRALQRSYNDQSARLAEAHANIATLTSTTAAKKAAVAVELLQMEESNRILQKRGDEARITIVERESELERMVEAHDERERMWTEKLKKEERLRKEAEKRAAELKNVAERLDMAEGKSSHLSASAAVAGEMRRGGKSYTELYTDFTIQESRLQASEAEVERLTELLDEISQELSEKKPLLDEQAAEHGRAIDRANTLASELAISMSTRDALQAEIKSVRAATVHHNADVAALESTANDLALQVKTLLRQLAIKDDPSLANVPVDGSAEVSPTGDIITDNLVEFRSIRSLQEQNQRLLKITRSLTARLDEREIRRAGAEQEDADAGVALDQATAMIQRLHGDLLDAQTRVNEAVRERDFFSKLLAKGEGLKWSQEHAGGGVMDDTPGPHEQTIATLQAELDMVKEKAQGEVHDARQEIKKKAEEAAVAMVDKAKAEAKIGLLEEQARALNESSALQKQEHASLETQLRQVQGVVAQAQSEARRALEQVAERQAEADRLRNESSMLRAEKEQWRSHESRLQADFAQVQSERVRLQHLIDNLKNVASESEKSRTEEREALEKRIDELQKDAATLRTQLQQARDAGRAAEQKALEAENRLTTAVSAIEATKDAEIAGLRTVSAAHEKTSEERRTIGLKWKSRADQLAELMNERNRQITEERGKLEEVNKEIERLKSKVDEAEKKVTEAERVASLKENTVQRLQSELNTARAAVGQAQAQSDNVAMAGIQSENAALQEQLTQAKKDLDAAKAEVAAASVSGDTPTAGTLTDAERTELLDKVQKLEKEAEEGAKRYENNVTVVNRSNGQLKGRLEVLVKEKAAAQEAIVSLQAKVAELEGKITILEAAATPAPAAAPTPEAGAAPAESDLQAAIAEAVKAATEELSAKHAKALEAATASVAANTTAETKMDVAALQAKEAELTASFGARVAAAVQAQHAALVADKAALQEEVGQLRVQVEELKNKIKTLERQARTSEITRKTLDRQKNELDKKLAEYESGTAVTSAAAPAAAAPAAPAAVDVKSTDGVLSAGAPAFKPAGESSTGAAATGEAAAAGETPVQSPTTRGAVRGRGVRGATVRGRGAAPGRPNPILSAVNAALTQSAPPSVDPTSPTGGVKRSLPEDGDAAAVGTAGDASSRASAGAAAGERGRVLKRPRGASVRGRGGRGGGAGGPGGAGGAGATS